MWFIIGIILGGAILAIMWLMRNKGVSFTWYEWLMGIVGVALLLFGIQNLVGGLTETEAMAGWLMLLIFGIPALILLIATWRLVVRRQRAGS